MQIKSREKKYQLDNLYLSVFCKTTEQWNLRKENGETKILASKMCCLLSLCLKKSTFRQQPVDLQWKTTHDVHDREHSQGKTDQTVLSPPAVWSITQAACDAWPLPEFCHPQLSEERQHGLHCVLLLGSICVTRLSFSNSFSVECARRPVTDCQLWAHHAHTVILVEMVWPYKLSYIQALSELICTSVWDSHSV